MAMIKFINGKNKLITGLVKSIDYITDENKTEVFSFDGIKKKDIQKVKEDEEALFVEKLLSEDNGDRAINYITKDNKTHEKLVTGINCSANSAFDEMMVAKHIHNKTDGRQFIHFVQSFHPLDNVSPELAHKIGLELLEYKTFKNFQVLAATHTDTNHVHSHFILNTVNIESGRKWRQSERELNQLKKYSNSLCKKYGLIHSIININTNEFEKSKYKSMGELKAHKKGRSWKTEAFYTIVECKNISTSREEFIENLEKLNYKVRWVEERRNITFTLTNGRKLNNDKLHPPEKFSKEGLLEQFKLNKEFEERGLAFNAKIKSENLQELYLKTTKFLFENPDQGHKDYPITYLEGQALKEKMLEEAKGRGLDFKDGKER